MKLKTQRLTLETLTMLDLEMVHALHSLPETDRFNTLGIPESAEVTKKILEGWLLGESAKPRERYTFTMRTAAEGEFVGLFGIRMGRAAYRSAEVWYKVHPGQWNRGFATEALLEVLRFCFNDLALHRIEAGCAADNAASAKVLEKAGFTKEGRTRKLLPIRGAWVDNLFYAILEEDFLK